MGLHAALHDLCPLLRPHVVRASLSAAWPCPVSNATNTSTHARTHAHAQCDIAGRLVQLCLWVSWPRACSSAPATGGAYARFGNHWQCLHGGQAHPRMIRACGLECWANTSSTSGPRLPLTRAPSPSWAPRPCSPAPHDSHCTLPVSAHGLGRHSPVFFLPPPLHSGRWRSFSPRPPTVRVTPPLCKYLFKDVGTCRIE